MSRSAISAASPGAAPSLLPRGPLVRHAPHARGGRRRRRAAVALLGAAVTILAGCTSPGGGDAAVAIAGSDIAVVPRDGVKDGGTMRWAVDGVPATLNAFQPDAGEETSRIAGAVLPALFRLDDRGRPQRDPDFLNDARVLAREPKQVVSFKLNPKATWSDGRAIGVDDFISQWNALSGKNAAYRSARNAGYDRIADVRQGREENEVQVTFATPFADWQSLFSPLYPMSVTSTPDAFNEGARTELATVAGPFAVRDVDGKGGTVTLVRNPAWWGARPKLDKLVLAAVPRDRRVEALTAGTVDVAEIDPTAYGRAVRQAKTISLRKAPDAAYAQLALNGSSGPLTDERVRRAVGRAIDRQAIADAVLKPVGLPARPLGNHLILASQDGYEDHSSALGGKDIASAQALLADAGWKPGEAAPAQPPASPQAKAAATATPSGTAKATGGPATSGAGDGKPLPDQTAAEVVSEPDPVLVKDGKPMTLRFVVPSSSPTLADVAVRIARMLAGVGVGTRITKVPDEIFFRDHVAAGDFDLALYSWPGTAYWATDDRPIFAKPLPAPDGSLTVEQNYTRVGSDRIDQLLIQAGTELDPRAARDLASSADARIWAAAGSIPLYQRPELVALRPSVANAGAFGFASPRYQDIGFRKDTPQQSSKDVRKRTPGPGEAVTESPKESPKQLRGQ